jgi:hypothetical protein
MFSLKLMYKKHTETCRSDVIKTDIKNENVHLVGILIKCLMYKNARD